MPRSRTSKQAQRVCVCRGVCVALRALHACKGTLCMIQPAKPSGKRCPRTVRNLCRVLPDARSVQPAPRHHGHVDKLVAEVLKRHVIVLWLVGGSNKRVTVTIE